jgi:hypothetical protein
MQNYEVIGNPVTFGIGIELKLSDHQAKVRVSSLQKKKHEIYAVSEPIQFKIGEKITIVSENLSKSILKDLKEISDKNTQDKAQDNLQYPLIQRSNFGRYNVFDRDGNLLNQKPLKKDEAEKMFLEIVKTNQANQEIAVELNNQNNV